MVNPRLAGRYAKSLIDLAQEQNQLETIYKDILYMAELLKASPEFESILKSPVIPEGKKLNILEALTSGKISHITASFNRLLIKKGRESFLPDMVEAFISQYKIIKGIYIVTLTTAIPVSDEVKSAIVRKIKEVSIMKEVELETIVQESIIGGFILESNGRRVDASVAFDLANVKKQFLKNDYMYKIR